MTDRWLSWKTLVILIYHDLPWTENIKQLALKISSFHTTWVIKLPKYCILVGNNFLQCKPMVFFEKIGPKKVMCCLDWLVYYIQPLYLLPPAHLATKKSTKTKKTRPPFFRHMHRGTELSWTVPTMPPGTSSIGLIFFGVAINSFYKAKQEILRRSTMNENVFPLEHGDFSVFHGSFQGCIFSYGSWKKSCHQIICGLSHLFTGF